MKLRHARLLALWRNFSLNLVSDSDEGHTSDRIFPFYLPVPQGQSISLEYYTVNILERWKEFCWRWETKKVTYYMRVVCVGMYVERNALNDAVLKFLEQFFKFSSDTSFNVTSRPVSYIRWHIINSGTVTWDIFILYSGERKYEMYNKMDIVFSFWIYFLFFFKNCSL